MRMIALVRRLLFRSGTTLAATVAALSVLTTACQEEGPSVAQSSADSIQNKQPLKIGSLLPATGDLSAVGPPLINAVGLLITTVNGCGGINGEPVTLISQDDQTEPSAGAEAMTRLAEVDKVAGVVGSFPSSVSSAAVDIAVRNRVVLISPGSTSPVFTERAKNGELKGFWARTAPPDTYQAQALAKLAQKRGFKRVSTIVINNDYGVGLEAEFTQAFKRLGGTVVGEDKPTRYDPKATTFASEAAAAFADKPDAVVVVVYGETGSLLLKTVYEQGLSQGVQIMLTDGGYSEEFVRQVGKTKTGQLILAGAIGTVPSADGKALQAFTQLWQQEGNQSLSAFVPHAWDATALLVLAAEAADANTSEGIQRKLRQVSGPPGIEVTDVCQGLEALRRGEEINYQGASGNVDLDANGDVVGSYDVWTVREDGKLEVVDKVNPAE